MRAARSRARMALVFAPHTASPMSTERHYGWMWLHALELADQAERLQRRFPRYLGPGTDAVSWEPPVDIHETSEGFVLFFALPGVAPEDIEVRLERAALTVTAKRRLEITDRDAVIRRLEIPHGRFVRQIALAGSALQIAETRYLNGCLEVRLVRAEGVR
jgi:HSP20 family protein